MNETGYYKCKDVIDFIKNCIGECEGLIVIVYIVLFYTDFAGYSDPRFVSTNRKLAERYVNKCYAKRAKFMDMTVQDYKEKYSKSYYEIFEREVVE